MSLLTELAGIRNTDSIAIETTEFVGHEWCKPSRFWSSQTEDGKLIPFPGAVTVESSAGPLLLCRVDKIVGGGGVIRMKRTPIAPESLNFAE